jgi:hypothetical protein
MLREIARGGLLTGVAASIAATLFCLVHLGKYDPWGLPAAAICLVTWAVSLVYWACDFGFRTATNRGFLGGPKTDGVGPRDRYRVTVMGMTGVILTCALLFTLVRPIITISRDLWRAVITPRVFMTLSRGQLYERLASGDPVDVNNAAWALHQRGLTSADHAVLAAIFVDARLPIDTRHDVGLFLAQCPPPHPASALSIVAGELDNDDPEWQVMTAEVLSQMAPDAPVRFELKVQPGDGGWRSDWEKYRTNVDLFRQWWKKRRMSDQ